MTTDELEASIQAIERAELSDAQRERLAAAIKRPRGRPRREPSISTIGPRYEAVITMRRLQATGLTQEEAAYRAAQEHGTDSDESIKSWAKRYGLRQMADSRLRADKKFHELLEEADHLGIKYANDWPISRIKEAIQNVKGKK